MVEEGYFEYGNFKFENGNFKKQVKVKIVAIIQTKKSSNA